MEILTEIVQILTGGIMQMATGIGTGLTSLVTSIFIDSTSDTQSLSVFGIVVCVFAGISLCVGLSRLVVTWISSLGGRGM